MCPHWEILTAFLLRRCINTMLWSMDPTISKGHEYCMGVKDAQRFYFLHRINWLCSKIQCILSLVNVAYTNAAIKESKVQNIVSSLASMGQLLFSLLHSWKSLSHLKLKDGKKEASSLRDVVDPQLFELKTTVTRPFI